MARLPIDKARLNKLGSGAITRYMRLVRSSARAVVIDPPDGHEEIMRLAPVILAMWHGQTLMVPLLKPEGLKVRIVVAMHGDGDLIGDAVTPFGLELIRGAGAGGRKRDRGGARALVACKKSLDEGWSVGMTADIPPGPARHAGLGIVLLAKVSGRPIVPVAVASSRYHALDSWSRMTINMPYSKLVQVRGDIIHVARDADEAALETARLAVERSLNEATARAYALAGADPKRATPDSADPSRPPAPPGRRLGLYRATMSAAEAIAPKILSWRERRGKEDPKRIGERLGIASIARPPGTLVWIHAASVGELNAILPLIDAMHAARDDLRFLVTTGTTTSAALAAARLPSGDIHQYIPLDSPNFVARFLDHWKPSLAVFTESELWPNLIIAAADRNITLALVNGRLSPTSYRRWMRQRGVSRPLLNRFAIVLAQTEKLSRWFVNIGARRSVHAGNLKVDAPPLPVDANALAALQAALGDRQRLLFACTHSGEEELAAKVHAALSETWTDFCTIIAPRHPERGPEIAAMLQGRGIRTALRSTGVMPDASTQVYIADTIGELGTLYRLSPIAYLGKSWGGSESAQGGQNPVEAIRLGSAVLTGPHVGNFHEIYQALVKQNGVITADTAEMLATSVRQLIEQPQALAGLNARAFGALAEMSGALALTVEKLMPLLADATDEAATRKLVRAS